MRISKTRSNRSLVLAAVAGSVVATMSSGVQAQSSWLSAVNGSWFDGTKWSPTGVPNSAGTNVTLGLAGAYTVSMQNQNADCGTLTLSNSAAVLNVFDNAFLRVSGNITNSGLIQISTPGSPGNLTRLVNNANIQISGAGTLRLSAAGTSGDSDAAYLQGANLANVLTNGSGHTIAGYGRIYTNLVNNGTVNADVLSKGLLLIDQPKTNNATMTASNGGFIQVRTTSLTQGAAGVCLSSNSSPVQFVNASISGGTLNGAGTSSGVQYYGSNSLDGVTLQNANVVTDNTLVSVTAGGVINNGTWTVSDPAAPGNLTRISVAAPTATIGGSGTIRLQAAAGNGDTSAAYLDYAAAVNVLTNGPSHSIKGYGRIYPNLVNNGTINADIANKGLFFIDQPKTNNGTITASNGGFVQFRSVTVTGNPAAQIISTDSASPVQMVSATMSGGGFATSGTGRFEYYSSNALANLTVNGTHQITDNSLVNLNTDLVNNGSWLISNPTAPGNLTRIQANAAAVTISGTGTIRLQGLQAGNGDNDSAYIHYGTAANVLTLGANQQLLGYGRVYTNLVNNGIINADNTPNASGPVSKGIHLQEQPKTNNATITSSNGGYWYIRNCTLTNNGLLLSSNTTTPGGGFENCTVTGGTITNVSGQAFGTAGAVNLNGSTITAGSGIQINDNTYINTTGLTNNGTFFISKPAAPGNLTRLQAAAATTTINGSGTIRLQGTSAGDNDSAYIYYTTAANQLVNTAAHTIAGYGRVYTNLVNSGTISADQAGKGLILLEQPKTNNATIASSNAGYWYVRGCTITNGPGGVMTSSNTTTSGGGFENCTIVGGTLTNISNEFFGTAGTSTFNGVTISTGSGVQINDNTTLTPGASGIVNNGTIAVQSIGAPGNATRILCPGASTISGTGTVKLQATAFSNDSSYLWGQGGAANPLTLGAGQALTGTGRLYGNIVLDGSISPDQPFGTPTVLGSIQPLAGTLVFGATSAFNCQLGSAAAYDSMQGNSAITIAAGATLNVSIPGAYDPTPGTSFDIVIGSSVTGTFTNVNFPPLLNKKQAFLVYGPTYVRLFVTCYANCDQSTGSPALTANDFQCFLNKFATEDPYANCDGSTAIPALTANDFQCFLNRYAVGCN